MESAQLIGKRFAVFVAGQDRNRWAQHFAQSMQVGGKKNIDVALTFDTCAIDVEASGLTPTVGAGITEMHLVLQIGIGDP
jgi:hypothetical protein